MNKNKLSAIISAYAAPAATILGGLILLFSPDTATVLISTVIGWAALILGTILAISAFAVKQGKGILQGLLSVAVGLWLTRNPMSLALVFGKLLGLALLIGAISGFRKAVSGAGRTIYLAEGAFGLVLLIAPLTASRLVYTILGLILVAAGVVMLVNKLKNNDRLGPGSKIIDV